MFTIGRRAILLAILVIVSAPATAQDFARLGGPFTREVVVNSPFSAHATTTVGEVYPDGTAHKRSVSARYFRDSRGHVRAEVDTPWGPYIVVAIAGAERVQYLMLDPATRTYWESHFTIAAQLFNGEGGVALPVGKNCFEYPPLVAEGTTEADRLQAVDADISPGLDLVRGSHRFDEIPVVGSKGNRIRRSFDYALTDIRHEEPPTSLFDIPYDYTHAIGRGVDPFVGFAPGQWPASCSPLTR
jgi:hypothetical protein